MISIAMVCLAAVVAAPAQPAEDKSVTGVDIDRRDGVTAFYATTAGRILSVATPADSGGKKSVVLLVAPASEKSDKKKEASPPKDPCAEPNDPVPERAAPRSLMRLELNGPGELRSLRDDLPVGAYALVAADVNADGRQDLVVVYSTGIAVALEDGSGAWSGPLETVTKFSDEVAGGRWVGAASSAADAALLWVVELGSVRSFVRNADATWRELPPIATPIHAKKKEATIQLAGAAISRIDETDLASPLAVAPEAAGGDRLRSVLIHPGSDDSQRSVECWSRLPGAEKLSDSQYLKLGATEVLMVATRPADKLSLFGEQLVRVFPLAFDRTRTGKAPLFAVESGANLWQEVHPSFIDVNGDAREDLILAYWKGLMDNTLVLDAYLRRENGSFESKARTTTFDVEQADRSVLVYGADADGAGLPDLLLVAGGGVRLYAGAPGPTDGRRLVASKPSWSAPLRGSASQERKIEISIGGEGLTMDSTESAEWSFRSVDLDGDGHREILCVPSAGFSSKSLAVFRAAPR